MLDALRCLPLLLISARVLRLLDDPMLSSSHACFSLICSLPSRPQLPDLSLFGVYDGHGGDSVAHYTARNFRDPLVRTGLLTPHMKPEEVEPRAKEAGRKRR